MIQTTCAANGVVTISLNRPEVHNAFNDEMMRQLTEAFVEVANMPDARLVVLRGEGKSFSAGADLQVMQAMKQASEAENKTQSELLAGVFHAVDSCPVPVLAVVQGAALGGGVGLVACCDYVLASKRAQFGLTEVRLGVVPAVICPYVLAKIGVSQARALFLSGQRFSADHALQIGLIHQVVEDELWCEERVDELVDGFLQAAPHAAQEAKRMIRVVAGLTEEAERMAYTTSLIARLRVAEEGQEGMQAFLEKRKPSWVKE